MKKQLVKVGYAPAVMSPDGSMTYEEIIKLETTLSGGREYSAEPVGDTTEVYADSVSVYTDEANNGYDIKLTLIALIDKVEKEWLGFAVDESGKTTDEYANAPARPRFALLVADATTDGKGEITVFYNCQVSKRPGISGKTAEAGKFDPQYQEFEIAARPRISDGLVRRKLAGNALPSKVPEPGAVVPPEGS